MKNYSEKLEKYNHIYADSVMNIFRNLKYGITACNTIDADLAFMRYELANWQASGDYSCLSEVRSNYKKWLPVNLCSDDMCYINVNINISGSKSFHVTTAQSVWLFSHNLGFNPNVTTTNEIGEEIVGLVDYVDSNTIQITFSEPVTGWAYLS